MTNNVFPTNNRDFKKFCEELNDKIISGTCGRYNKKANWLSAQIASSLPNKHPDYNINTLKSELNSAGLMKFRRNRTPTYQVDLEDKNFNKALTHEANWVTVKLLLPNHNVLVDIDGKEIEITPEEFLFMVEGCEMHGTTLFDMIENNLPVLVDFQSKGEKGNPFGYKRMELLILNVDGSHTALFRQDNYFLCSYSIHDASEIWTSYYDATSGDPEILHELEIEIKR